ncbi:hypothetical protein [Pantoea sp. JGM49]|uniref:hypothetical protein n=1 Tax=Pantoea sp. JGM49 TaxID=2799791 RepID=UPI0024B1CA7F|nr:hypothetical protein [Pantoea sp. JGM49]
MHLLYCGIMPTVLQGWLGHADFRNRRFTSAYSRWKRQLRAAGRSASGWIPARLPGCCVPETSLLFLHCKYVYVFTV